MVLIRGTFLSKIEVDQVDNRYVFLISPEDLELLGVPSVRHYDPRIARIPPPPAHTANLGGDELISALRRREDTRVQAALLAHRSFVVRLSYNPEAKRGRPDDTPFPGLLPPMDERTVGTDFWVLLHGPWRTKEVHFHEGMNLFTSQYTALGIYPVYSSAAELGNARSQLDEIAPRYCNRAMPDLRTSIDAQLAASSRPAGLLNYWWRLWGISMSMPNVFGIRQVGQRLYGRDDRTSHIADYYAAFARTGDGAAAAHPDYRMLPIETERDHNSDQPLATTVFDLSDPHSFGAPGSLLPLAMIDNPYAFVGPVSVARVTGAGKPGSGVRYRFPWWCCELLAQAVHGSSPETQQARASAVAYETIRYLELRAHEAFREYTREGRPRRGEHDNSGLDLDAHGPLPRGSVAFPRDMIERGLQRRVADLEGVIEANPLAPIRQVTVCGTECLNPYPALAGYLGVTLQPLTELRAVAACWETIEGVAESIQFPGIGRGAPEWRYGLRERVQAARRVLQAIEQQQVRVGSLPLLPVQPPLRADDPRWTKAYPPADRLLLTGSQSSALRMVSLWRFSVVTGEAGTGKTKLLRELCRMAFELGQSLSSGVMLLVLTPTNRAARQALDVLREQTDDIQLLGHRGGEMDAGDMYTTRTGAGVVIGTIDSCLSKAVHDDDFRNRLGAQKVIVAFEEGNMVTTEAFLDVLRLFQMVHGTSESGFTVNEEQFEIAPNLLRVVLIGAPSQLRSMEPGDLLSDMLAVLPNTRLLEQIRYGEAENGDIRLFDLFTRVHDAMGDRQLRIEVVNRLIESATVYSPGPMDSLRVVLIDDLPAVDDVPQLNPAFFRRFRLAVEDEVRRAVFAEILDWSRVELSPTSRVNGRSYMPRVRQNSGRAEQATAIDDYNRFAGAMLEPTLPFVVLTMLRTPFGGGERLDMRSHYISSSERVNGWVHDALLGRLVDPDPGIDPVRPARLPKINGDERVRYIAADTRSMREASQVRHERYSTLWQELAVQRDQREALRTFVSDYRPNTLALARNWPYVVQTNDFKPFGIVRGERVWYREAAYRPGANMHVFRGESGLTMTIPERFCTRAYFSYGWAMNVHQVQGAESPLTIVLWLDAISPQQMIQQWDRIRPPRDGKRVLPVADPLPPRTGGSRYPMLDDMLDLHALYTALTRTQTRASETMVVQGQQQVQTRNGRCVIIAGKYALRRLIDLESMPRVTAFEGLLWELVQKHTGAA